MGERPSSDKRVPSDPDIPRETPAFQEQVSRPLSLHQDYATGLPAQNESEPGAEPSTFDAEALLVQLRNEHTKGPSYWKDRVARWPVVRELNELDFTQGEIAAALGCSKQIITDDFKGRRGDETMDEPEYWEKQPLFVRRFQRFANFSYQREQSKDVENDLAVQINAREQDKKNGWPARTIKEPVFYPLTKEETIVLTSLGEALKIKEHIAYAKGAGEAVRKLYVLQAERPQDQGYARLIERIFTSRDQTRSGRIFSASHAFDEYVKRVALGQEEVPVSEQSLQEQLLKLAQHNLSRSLPVPLTPEAVTAIERVLERVIASLQNDAQPRYRAYLNHRFGLKGVEPLVMEAAGNQIGAPSRTRAGQIEKRLMTELKKPGYGLQVYALSAEEQVRYLQGQLASLQGKTRGPLSIVDTMKSDEQLAMNQAWELNQWYRNKKVDEGSV